jgi:chitinase
MSTLATEDDMKLVQLSDEGDKPIVVNADTVCFLRRCAPDRVEIHFVGETSTKVRGTVEFVKIALEGVLGLPSGRQQASTAHAEKSLTRQN